MFFHPFPLDIPPKMEAPEGRLRGMFTQSIHSRLRDLELLPFRNRPEAGLAQGRIEARYAGKFGAGHNGQTPAIARACGRDCGESGGWMSRLPPIGAVRTRVSTPVEYRGDQWARYCGRIGAAT